MQNGSSHVRKFLKLLSADTLAIVSEELQTSLAHTEAQLGKQDAGSTVGKLIQDKLTYISDVQEIAGKVQFEKIGG